MSEAKLREALIMARGELTMQGYEPHDDLLRVIDEALAQPTEAVELTDSELAKAVGCKRLGVFALNMCRAAIAAHEALTHSTEEIETCLCCAGSGVMEDFYGPDACISCGGIGYTEVKRSQS